MTFSGATGRALSKLAFAVTAFLAAGSALSASVELYLSPPSQQTSTRPGTTIETFDLRTGPVANGAPWLVGAYTAIDGDVVAADVFGGASGTPYLNLGANTINVTLNGDRRYVGFWWSAGDNTNTIQFFDASNNLLASFNTADLVTILTNNQRVTAINGQQYASADYFGNPNAQFDANGSRGNLSQPYGYINLVISGTTSTFKRIEISGTNFELDNIAIADTVAVDPNWVNYGNVPLAVPPGEISAVPDTATTLVNRPVGGSVAANDTAPAQSTYSVAQPPSNGTITIGTSGAFSYTPNAGFVGTDTVLYRVCKPAPNGTSCTTAQLTITVAPAAAVASIPTLSQWGVLLLSSVLGLLTLGLMRRR